MSDRARGRWLTRLYLVPSSSGLSQSVITARALSKHAQPELLARIRTSLMSLMASPKVDGWICSLWVSRARLWVLRRTTHPALELERKGRVELAKLADGVVALDAVSVWGEHRR